MSIGVFLFYTYRALQVEVFPLNNIYNYVKFVANNLKHFK